MSPLDYIFVIALTIIVSVLAATFMIVRGEEIRAATRKLGPEEMTIALMNTDAQDFIHVHGISVETAKWYSNTEFVFQPGYEMVLRRLNPHQIAVIRRVTPNAQAPG